MYVENISFKRNRIVREGTVTVELWELIKLFKNGLLLIATHGLVFQHANKRYVNKHQLSIKLNIPVYRFIIRLTQLKNEMILDRDIDRKKDR